MLEEAVPALWSAFHGFFTPTVLFILNVIIGTIAVTSKLGPPTLPTARTPLLPAQRVEQIISSRIRFVVAQVRIFVAVAFFCSASFL
jgi:hypothetical protein